MILGNHVAVPRFFPWSFYLKGLVTIKLCCRLLLISNIYLSLALFRVVCCNLWLNLNLRIFNVCSETVCHNLKFFIHLYIFSFPISNIWFRAGCSFILISVVPRIFAFLWTRHNHSHMYVYIVYIPLLFTILLFSTFA